jgi:HEPN domain-containing protein
MMHERRPPEEAADWLRYAAEDFRIAQLLIDQRDLPTRHVLQHAQQCAEKALKALLIARGEAYPLTHNIAHLTALCRTLDPEIGHLAKACSDLSPYAGFMRYPGEDREPTLSQAMAWVQATEALLVAVNERLRVS